MTDTTNTTAAVVATGLTAGEIAALKGLGGFAMITNSVKQTLIDKGLAEWVKQDQFLSVLLPTDLGKRVLEALEAAPAEARPAVISSREYYTGNWVMTLGVKISYEGHIVRDVTPSYNSQADYHVYFTDGDWIPAEASDEFSVTWLDAAVRTPPAQAVGEGIAPLPPHDTELGNDYVIITEVLESEFHYSCDYHPETGEDFDTADPKIIQANEAWSKCQAELATLRRDLAASRERERVAILTPAETKALSADELVNLVIERVFDKALIATIDAIIREVPQEIDWGSYTMADSIDGSLFDWQAKARTLQILRKQIDSRCEALEALQPKDATSESEVGK